MSRKIKIPVVWTDEDDDEKQSALVVSGKKCGWATLSCPGGVPASDIRGMKDGLKSIGVNVYCRKAVYMGRDLLFVFCMEQLSPKESAAALTKIDQEG